MRNDDLVAIVVALEERGCKLVIEWERGGVTAIARKELWYDRYRYDAIRAHAPTFDEALVLLADSIEKAEWQDDEAVVAEFAEAALQRELGKREEKNGDAGVTFRAKQEAFLPDGVEGPTIVYEAGCVTVTTSEAEILRTGPDTWEEVGINDSGFTSKKDAD